MRAREFVPAEAKLRPPALRRACVQRGQLVDRLRETPVAPVVVVTAPAGYGKTTAMAQWAAEDDRSFAWLSLDEADNDPAVLLTYLVLALQVIEPVSSALLARMAAERSAALPLLSSVIRQRSCPFVLVLDNAHALTAPAAQELLQVVADNLPDGSQLAVVGRRSTALPWHQLRLERRLLDIDLDDLRLTVPESEALLESMQLDVPAGAVTGLLERTQGWAAGLCLGALALEAGGVSASGDDEVVAQYLREEVLHALPAKVQSFLMQVSVLEELSGPLCDALLGTTGAGLLLQQLRAENLFVVSLDPHGEWYRLHALFRDMLRAEQRRREPGKTRGLHARASRWLEADGDAEGSIRHAHAAHELQRAAHLVWTQVAGCIDRGDHATLERWLDAFSPAEVMGQAQLSLTAAWTAFLRGRAVDPWLAAAAHGAYDANQPDEAEAVTAAVALLRATLAQHGVVRMCAEARMSARLQAPGNPWRCLSTYLVGVSLHLRGQRQQANEVLHEAVAVADAMDMHIARVLILTQQAVLALEENDWQRGEELAQQAVSAVEDAGADPSPALAVVSCLKTLVMSRAGLAAEARRESRAALRLLALNVQVPPWSAVQSRNLLARAHLILGDTAATRMLLSEAQGLLAEVPDAPVLQEQLDELWRQVESSPVVHAGLSTLTTAELRVLQYLPTHLSFEQISQRLHVSRNTVKTQAIAGYRKLGVVSRADAVDRGYALGLIQAGT